MFTHTLKEVMVDGGYDSINLTELPAGEGKGQSSTLTEVLNEDDGTILSVEATQESVDFEAVKATIKKDGEIAWEATFKVPSGEEENESALCQVIIDQVDYWSN